MKVEAFAKVDFLFEDGDQPFDQSGIFVTANSGLLKRARELALLREQGVVTVDVGVAQRLVESGGASGPGSSGRWRLGLQLLNRRRVKERLLGQKGSVAESKLEKGN